MSHTIYDTKQLAVSIEEKEEEEFFYLTLKQTLYEYRLPW